MQTLLYYYYYYCYYYSIIFVTLYSVKRVNIVLERTREGHRQSDEDWYCFKGNVGETSERWGGVHIGFSECIDIILN